MARSVRGLRCALCDAACHNTAAMQCVLAVLMPPHGRVNYRCWPVWNADKTNLKVVWSGIEYAQPWLLNEEVDGN